ncbi:MAG: DUF134 domain-containing protein [Spirochaetes bacterium]|jgi:predicted DNA-binding protein (UPF0251 family)|nr:DUF134 domain-containing protein [Spirochaetota bacterium]
MARPLSCRRIHADPGVLYYKPRGVPSSALEEEVLTLDEFEAVRLVDHQGLYQEEAAARMNVSRQTLGRIVESARKKIAGALVGGRAIRIEGGAVELHGEHCGCPERGVRCRGRGKACEEE